MGSTVALLAALDTKAQDAEFIRNRLRAMGHHVILVDVGVLGDPQITSDISRAETAAAGGNDLAELRSRADRSHAVEAMARGASDVVRTLYESGAVQGVFALGGGAGTTIGAAAMQRLPLGVPKVILTTVAAGNTLGYVGTSDIVMFPSVVDIAGINRISALTYARAADAMSGMLSGLVREAGEKLTKDRPVVAATMFGVTTPCVMRAKEQLEAAGCEVLIFHATGAGGRTMERLIKEGFVDAVLDITTTELADEIVGGILTAGPHRLEAAAARGIAQVVSLGATDMVNFGAPDTVPERFRNRLFYNHNAENTLMRVSVEEAEQIGTMVAEKLNRANKSPVVLLLPLRGISALDAEDQPFNDPSAREALFSAVTSSIDNERVEVREVDVHINDNAFADIAAGYVLSQLKENQIMIGPETSVSKP